MLGREECSIQFSNWTKVLLLSLAFAVLCFYGSAVWRTTVVSSPLALSTPLDPTRCSVVASREAVMFHVPSVYSDPVIHVQVIGGCCSQPTYHACNVTKISFMNSLKSMKNLKLISSVYNHKTAIHNLTFILYYFPLLVGEYYITIRLEYQAYEAAVANFVQDGNKLSFVGETVKTVVSDVSRTKFRDCKDHDEASSSWHILSSCWEHQVSKPEWLYYDNLNYPKCKLSKSLEIIIIGDSQPNYFCEYFRSINKLTRLRIKCIKIKHTLPETFPIYEETFNSLKSNSSPDEDRYLFFNFAGLWEVAYGDFSVYESYLDKLFNLVYESRSHRLIFMTTTAVHPINYDKAHVDNVKFAMNQVRVDKLNEITTDFINSISQDSPKQRIDIIDFNALTRSRQDDPMTPTDMRHFGNSTNQEMVDALLKMIYADYC